MKRRSWFGASSGLGFAFLLAAVSVDAAQGAAMKAGASADSAKAVRDSITKVSATADSAKSDQARIVDLERELERVKKQLADTNDLALSDHNRLQILESRAPADSVSQALAARLAELEESSRRAPEVAPDKLSSAEFPGSMPIPGTDAALRVGGQARFIYAHNFAALGSEGRFIAATIPIAGTEAAGKGPRTAITANPSRISFDMRSPTGVGYIRTYIEGDFRGQGNTLRMRHAYGQWHGVIAGQTWSTFSDPEAEPDGIDLEGLNAISLFRQGQVRYSTEIKTDIFFAVAVEDPAPSLTGAVGVSQAPDLVFRLRWKPAEDKSPPFIRGGHLQSALLLREIRGEAIANQTLGTYGFGLNLTGRISAPWGGTDRVLFAVNGGLGIGRYIADLSAEGGQDAVYDSVDNDLDALPALSGYLGVEHWWGKMLRSTVTYGVVDVDNLPIQGPEAYDLTRRASINLVYSPIKRLDLVTEYLWGERENKNGEKGTSSQIQIGSRLVF